MKIYGISLNHGASFNEDNTAIVDPDGNAWNVGDKLLPVAAFEAFGPGSAFDETLRQYAERKEMPVNKARKEFIDLAFELSDEDLITIDTGEPDY
jgi:hypothetical protein